MRKRIKYFCIHFWRDRYYDGRRDGFVAVRCSDCHDRRMGGVWFFKSLGFK